MHSLRHQARRGKIARLPKRIRDELNLRLDDAETATTLLPWLNSLPEVQTVLATQFDARPITKQNLSAWRQDGWQEWLMEQGAYDAANRIPEDTRELLLRDATGQPSLVETLAHWLTTRYMLATRRIDRADEDTSWRLLQDMIHGLDKLQRITNRPRRLAHQSKVEAFKASQRAMRDETPMPAKTALRSKTASHPENPSESQASITPSNLAKSPTHPHWKSSQVQLGPGKNFPRAGKPSHPIFAKKHQPNPPICMSRISPVASTPSIQSIPSTTGYTSTKCSASPTPPLHLPKPPPFQTPPKTLILRGCSPP